MPIRADIEAPASLRRAALGSVLLHAAALAGLLLSGRIALLAPAPEPLSVDLAFLPPGEAGGAKPATEAAPAPVPAPAEAPSETPPPEPPPEPSPAAAAPAPPPDAAVPPAEAEAPQEAALPLPPPPPPRPVVTHRPVVPPPPAARPLEVAVQAPSLPLPASVAPLPSTTSGPAPGPAPGSTHPGPANPGLAGPAPGAPAVLGPPGPSGTWMQAIDAWIDAHLVYPEPARRRGEQGVVVLRLTLAHDGRVLALGLLRASGHDALDDAALDLFHDARLPAATPADPPQLVIEKPIRFHLD